MRLALGYDGNGHNGNGRSGSGHSGNGHSGSGHSGNGRVHGRIAVIGGGLAGITAALDCAERGADVVLLESRPRLGGAAYSVHRNGLYVDNGQHVFLRCCESYRELLARIGALGGVTLQSQLAIPVIAPGREPVWLRRQNLPAPAHLAKSLIGYRFLSPGERAAAALAMNSLKKIDPDDPVADRRSFGDWLREHHQSPRAIERLWGLIARPTLNLVPDDASLAQAAYVFQTGLLSEASAGDIGWARIPLSDIHDGPARQALQDRGAEVHLRMRAERITRTPDGRFQVEVSGGPTICADAVVVAVPHDRLGRLVPDTADVNTASLARLGSSPIVNLHIVYDRRVLELPFVAGVDSPVQWLFDRSDGAGAQPGTQYLAVTLSAAEEESRMTVDELRERFVGAIADLLPAAREAQLIQFFVTREHAATFRAEPGARRLRPGATTKLPGLVLAGAWTDTGWPATMEGAVRSGHAAAREAIRALAARAAPAEMAVAR